MRGGGLVGSGQESGCISRFVGKWAEPEGGRRSPCLVWWAIVLIQSCACEATVGVESRGGQMVSGFVFTLPIISLRKVPQNHANSSLAMFFNLGSVIDNEKE